ncbi:DNA alkylation repair protein [Thalassoglobus sp. JC818]|uniref:DNA alkylation repair protein n=1 Tax=Thalassoglobus sp. JC818 TaxID=3232136 RepID=UPI0034592441
MSKKKHKDWFDETLAEWLADRIAENHRKFNREAFVNKIRDGISDLELKARVALFAKQLQAHLPRSYEAAIPIILKCLGDENPNETGMFTEYYWVMPFATFVEHYGLDYLEISLNAIGEITKRNTGEFAIRPYLSRYPEQTLDQMLKWSEDENFHLRRLASEGSRPRLPWAKKLDFAIEDPKSTLPILENLKDDQIRFVQKSVANHLNDMLKDNRDVAMKVLKRWKRGATDQRKWIIKHALRQELKAGIAEAQSLVE